MTTQNYVEHDAHNDDRHQHGCAIACGIRSCQGLPVLNNRMPALVVQNGGLQPSAVMHVRARAPVFQICRIRRLAVSERKDPVVLKGEARCTVASKD